MKFFLLFIISIILSFVVGFTIVPKLQEIEIFTTCLTVFSICLALYCFFIPKWEVWRDKLFASDEFVKERILDNIEGYKQLLSNNEKIKEIAPELVQTSQEIYKNLLKSEFLKLKNYYNLHKIAESPIIGYKQIILFSIFLLVFHFVLNVILIPSDSFVNLIKEEVSFVNTDSLIWLVKRFSSSIKILNIAVQFVFLYKIAKDTIDISLCLKSKEYI